MDDNPGKSPQENGEKTVEVAAEKEMASTSGSSVFRDALEVLTDEESGTDYQECQQGSSTAVLDPVQDQSQDMVLAETRRMSYICIENTWDEKLDLQAKKMSLTAIQNAFSSAAEMSRSDGEMAQTSSSASPAVHIALSKTMEMEARKMSTTALQKAFSAAASDNQKKIVEPRQGVFRRIISSLTSCCGRRNR
ncbi:uncharacterized protein LOC133190914 [Saccostrea echinata]|uniref:uncharacterized protein LOC133190914 n=1 Tax=Saccostrea echinata TaxID=191078 RepID=UPI002A833BB1|nr:uncharacterized protein LOC133190914 [Saccostrea echinata]